MGNRRFVPTSDDEDDAPLHSRNSKGDENQNKRKRKKVHIPDDDDEEKEMDERKLSELNKKKKRTEEPEPEAASENEEQEDVEAVPLGEVIRVSGKGRGRKNHYSSFEYDGLQYELEDPVLLVPEKGNQKPYVVIIKDISKTREGQVMVTGQWFYRPEEAEKRGGGNWESRDTRELFYSFHRDEVPAESVMHKCVVHFIPQNKQIPHRKEHPGFIVQKVYDTELRRLFKLTDKDYEEDKQHEIDLLVQKTHATLGDLPDLEPEDAYVDHDDQIKNKRLLRKRNVSPLDVSKEDDGVSKFQSLKAETPGTAGDTASQYFSILSNFKILAEETQRDKWLEKHLQSIQFMCTPVGSKQNDKEKSDGKQNDDSNQKNESHDKIPNVSFDSLFEIRTFVKNLCLQRELATYPLGRLQRMFCSSVFGKAVPVAIQLFHRAEALKAGKDKYKKKYRSRGRELRNLQSERAGADELKARVAELEAQLARREKMIEGLKAQLATESSEVEASKKVVADTEARLREVERQALLQGRRTGFRWAAERLKERFLQTIEQVQVDIGRQAVLDFVDGPAYDYATAFNGLKDFQLGFRLAVNQIKAKDLFPRISTSLKSAGNTPTPTQKKTRMCLSSRRSTGRPTPLAS